MAVGMVKFYSEEKGYGFIYHKYRQEDIFFHINDWKNPSVPCANDDVEFEIAEASKQGKEKAINIILVKSSTEKKDENFTKNDDRIICTGCKKKIVPRIITSKGSATHTMCPYCGEVIKKFGYCFIATAVYEDYNHPKVMILRQFRDNYLLTNTSGKKFVDFYYKNSPKFADYIKDKKIISYPIRKILDCFSFILDKYFIK